MNHFLLSLLVGAPITFLGTSMFVGGVEDAFQLIAMSIICTAGVGLIFWIPVTWISGAITIWLLVMVFPSSRLKKIPRESEGRGNDREFNILLNYLQKIRSQGLSVDKARQNLIQAGWKESEIDLALALVDW